MGEKINLLQLPLEGTATQKDPLGLEPIPEDTRQRFLRFRLSGENGAFLPVQDILAVRPLKTTDILPIPEISSSILGVCSWHSEILWLIDLNVLVGDLPLWEQAPVLEEPIAIVVQSPQQSVGLVVEKVDDVELLDPASLHQPTDLCPSELTPFVVGYLPDHQGTVLDAIAIVEYFLQQSH